MNTGLGQDSVEQLAFRKRKIRIIVIRKDVAEQKRHPDLSQSGHASAHDLHPPLGNLSCKILSRGTQ